MTLHPWLLLGHILAGMIWLGGGMMLVFVACRARASADPAAIPDFGRSLSYLGPRALAPAVIGVLVFGVALVVDGGGDFGQAWVLIALGLFVLAFLIGAVYLSQVGRQLERSGAGDPATARRLLDRWLAGYGVVLVLLVLSLADMVFKPWR